MKKVILTIILFILTLFIAEGSQAQNVNFSVQPVLPENQVDKNQSYFDLRMQPGQQQELKLIISNRSDQKAFFTVEPTAATTNRNGNIDYGTSKQPKDNTLKKGFNELVVGETEYELEPNSETEASFQLTMPEESYDGIILGGFYVTKQVEDKEPEEGQFKNVISYAIGVKLVETDAVVEPELAIHEITPMLDNYRTAVSVNIQNKAAAMVGGMTVKTEISQKGATSILYSAKAENMSMAPNSNFNFPISWNDEKIKAGNYHLHMVITDKDNHEWIFDKDFKIKKEAAQDLNVRAVNLEDSQNNTLWLIIGGLVLLLFVLGILLCKQRKKIKN